MYVIFFFVVSGNSILLFECKKVNWNPTRLYRFLNNLKQKPMIVQKLDVCAHDMLYARYSGDKVQRTFIGRDVYVRAQYSTSFKTISSLPRGACVLRLFTFIIFVFLFYWSRKINQLLVKWLSLDSIKLQLARMGKWEGPRKTDPN